MAHDFAYAKSSVLDFCEKNGRNGGFGCGNKRRFIPDALRFVIMHPHHNLNHIVSDYDVDGVCSGFILSDYLSEIGGNVTNIIPEMQQIGSQIISQPQLSGIHHSTQILPSQIIVDLL